MVELLVCTTQTGHIVKCMCDEMYDDNSLMVIGIYYYFYCHACDSSCIFKIEELTMEKTYTLGNIHILWLDYAIDMVEYIENDNPNYLNKDSHFFCSNCIEGEYVFSIVNLLKIDRISNFCINNYRMNKLVDYTYILHDYLCDDIIKCINEYSQISEYEIEKLIDFYPDDVSVQKIIEKYHLELIDANDISSSYKYFWNISFPVDSYFIDSPKIPYPDTFPTSADVGKPLSLLVYDGENKCTIDIRCIGLI